MTPRKRSSHLYCRPRPRFFDRKRFLFSLSTVQPREGCSEVPHMDTLDGGYIRVEGSTQCAPDVYNTVNVSSRVPRKCGFSVIEAPWGIFGAPKKGGFSSQKARSGPTEGWILTQNRPLGAPKKAYVKSI